jgi:hypothetical protein
MHTAHASRQRTATCCRHYLEGQRVSQAHRTDVAEVLCARGLVPAGLVGAEDGAVRDAGHERKLVRIRRVRPRDRGVERAAEVPVATTMCSSACLRMAPLDTEGDTGIASMATEPNMEGFARHACTQSILHWLQTRLSASAWPRRAGTHRSCRRTWSMRPCPAPRWAGSPGGRWPRSAWLARHCAPKVDGSQALLHRGECHRRDGRLRACMYVRSASVTFVSATSCPHAYRHLIAAMLSTLPAARASASETGVCSLQQAKLGRARPRAEAAPPRGARSALPASKKPG